MKELSHPRCTRCPMFSWSNQNNTKCECWSNRYAQYGSCASCPEGKISSHGSTHVTQCTTCPPGKYLHEHVCEECEAGKFSSSSNRHYCNLCDAGKYSEPGSIMCTNCPAGFVQHLSGKECDKCSEYTVSESNECKLCPQGYEPKDNICTQCTSGLYNVEEGYARLVHANTNTLVQQSAYHV